MPSIQQLSNKLTIVTNPMPSTDSVTVLVLVGAGSRYETKDINGISHYLEHLFFKGGKRYKSSKEVSSAIDGIGGEMNAFTGKEYAGYYNKVASTHLEKSIDVLSDMMLNAQFDPIEINKERGVILEEFNMYQDTPMYQVLWDFERVVFGDQPLGWDEVGTKDFILQASHDHFVQYKNMLYAPDNTVISVAGKFDEQHLFQLLQQYFQFPDTTKGKQFTPYTKKEQEKKVSVTNKKTEQAHLVLGVESLTYQDKRRYALQVMSTILGGNMSSRMFQRIREERGLAYYVQTSSSEYNDMGVLYTRAGVTLKDAYDVVQLIRNEYETITKEPVTTEELQRAKEYIKGKTVLSFEDSESVAHYYGRQQLLTGTIETVQEELANIDKVTMEDIQHVSQDLLSQTPYLSIIGPFEDTEKFEALLKE